MLECGHLCPRGRIPFTSECSLPAGNQRHKHHGRSGNPPMLHPPTLAFNSRHGRCQNFTQHKIEHRYTVARRSHFTHHASRFDMTTRQTTTAIATHSSSRTRGFATRSYRDAASLTRVESRDAPEQRKMFSKPRPGERRLPLQQLIKLFL